MFLHGGWLHVIGNMMVLWVFGNSIEEVLGGERYLFLYFYCGITAALTQAFLLRPVGVELLRPARSPVFATARLRGL
jgi:membrane associated rhomboid family serine protease